MTIEGGWSPFMPPRRDPDPEPSPLDHEGDFMRRAALDCLKERTRALRDRVALSSVADVQGRTAELVTMIVAFLEEHG